MIILRIVICFSEILDYNFSNVFLLCFRKDFPPPRYKKMNTCYSFFFDYTKNSLFHNKNEYEKDELTSIYNLIMSFLGSWNVISVMDLYAMTRD